MHVDDVVDGGNMCTLMTLLWAHLHDILLLCFHHTGLGAELDVGTGAIQRLGSPVTYNDVTH